MKTETATFELRDNEMRELTLAETDEVAGGTGVALIEAVSLSGSGSSQTLGIDATLSTTNTSALAIVTANISATGANNAASLAALAQVF
jgi:hypothetical protein